MKRKLATTVLYTALGLTASAMAQEDQINFSGKTLKAGCQINGSVTSTQEAKLGEMSKRAAALLALNDYLPIIGYGNDGIAKGVEITLLNSDSSGLPPGAESKSISLPRMRQKKSTSTFSPAISRQKMR